MPVPKKRQTKGSQGSRRSHIRLAMPYLTRCEHCKQFKLPHAVCRNCGYYKGREVINVLAKELKKQEKRKKQTH